MNKTTELPDFLKAGAPSRAGGKKLYLIGGALVGGVLWWRTREIRRQWRGEIERMQAAFERAASHDAGAAAPEVRPRGGSRHSPSSSGNVVIDGDFIRDVDGPDTRRS